MPSFTAAKTVTVSREKKFWRSATETKIMQKTKNTFIFYGSHRNFWRNSRRQTRLDSSLPSVRVYRSFSQPSLAGRGDVVCGRPLVAQSTCRISITLTIFWGVRQAVEPMFSVGPEWLIWALLSVFFSVLVGFDSHLRPSLSKSFVEGQRLFWGKLNSKNLGGAGRVWIQLHFVDIHHKCKFEQLFFDCHIFFG